MNARIEELITQATVEVPLYYGPAGFSHTRKFDKEKFAKLIVAECGKVVENVREQGVICRSSHLLDYFLE